MSTENTNPSKEKNGVKRRNELLGFDKNGELEYIGYCGVAINCILKVLQIKVDGKEDAIESSFNNEFVKNKNILCITAIKKTNDIVLVFTKEDTCQKVLETIEKIKREKLNFICNKEISDKTFKERFLPRFLKSNKTGDDSCRLNIIIDATINPILIDAFDEETENDEIGINELEPVYEKEASVIDLPEIHETNNTVTNNENIIEPPAKKAKMVTFSENESITASEFQSSSIVNTKIIPSSTFHLIKFDNMGFSFAKLSIFVSNNRNLCYEYICNNKKSNYFACDGCKKQNKTTKAIFSNGNKEIEIDETPHICEPRIYKPYIRENNIIKKGGFDVKLKLQRGSQTEVLFIYDDAKLELCRIFTYEKRTKKYICTKCTKIKMFAFLHEPLGEEVYVQFGYGEHDCKPIKYSELDPKKYISYWEISVHNENSSLSTGNDSIRKASMTTQKVVSTPAQADSSKQPCSSSKKSLLPPIKIKKEVTIATKTIEFLPISYNLFQEEQDSHEILFEAKNNNLELDASNIENNDNHETSSSVMKVNDNTHVETQNILASSSKITETANSNNILAGTSTPIEKDLFWNFMENPIVDKRQENLIDKNAEKTNILDNSTNCIFYTKFKFPLLEKRKYTNLLPAISNSEIGSPNCTFYSKRKNNSQSKSNNPDLCSLQEGYGQKDPPNSSDSLSECRDADFKNLQDASIATNQNYSNHESPQPIDYDYYGQNDYELNHVSNKDENNIFEKCDTNIDKNNVTLNVPNQIHSSRAPTLNARGSNQNYGCCSPSKNFSASRVNPPIISKNGLPSIIPRSNIRILKPIFKKTSSSVNSKKPTYVIKILNSKPVVFINKPLTHSNKILNAQNDTELMSSKSLPNNNASGAKSDEAAIDFPTNQPIIILNNIQQYQTPKNLLRASLVDELNNLATTNLTENEIIHANQFSHGRLERNIQNDIISDYHPPSAAIWNSNHEDHENDKTTPPKSKEGSQHSILYKETIKNVQKLNNNLIKSSQFLHKNIAEEISNNSDETFSLPGSSKHTMPPTLVAVTIVQDNSDQETTDLDNNFLAATIDNNKNKEEILKIHVDQNPIFCDNNLPSSSINKKHSSPPQTFSIQFNMENLETKKDHPPNYKAVKNPSNQATLSTEFNSVDKNNFHEKPRNQPTNIFPVNFGPTIEEPEEYFSIQILEKPKSIKPLTQLQTFPRPNLPPKLLNNQIFKFSFIKNSSNGQRELHASCELNPKNYYIFIFHSQTKIYRCGQCWNKGRLVSAKVCKDLKDNTKISLHIFGKHICKPFTHL